MRKSPRRHHVKSYKRKGFIVRDYMRGKGTTLSTLTRRRKIEKPKSARDDDRATYLVLSY